MGVAKRELEAREAMLRAGVDLCVLKQVLEECGDHPDTYFEGPRELSEVRPIVVAEWTQGLHRSFSTARKMTDAMRSAVDDNPSGSCPSCDRQNED